MDNLHKYCHSNSHLLLFCWHDTDLNDEKKLHFQEQSLSTATFRESLGKSKGKKKVLQCPAHLNAPLPFRSIKFFLQKEWKCSICWSNQAVLRVRILSASSIHGNIKFRIHIFLRKNSLRNVIWCGIDWSLNLAF